MTNDDLDALEGWAEPLLNRLEPKARKKLMSDIGRRLAKSQRDRIKRQKNPDGSPFAPRREKEQIKKPISFLYRKPGGGERVGSMVSFRDEGDRMVGYDREVDGIRTFLKHRVQYYMRPKHTGGALRGQRGSIRRKPMFTKIRQARYLKPLGTSADGVTVGFVSGVARFARIHQYGLRAQVEPGGNTADYPSRRLLGLTDADNDMIRDSLLDAIAPR
ncbi:phage virion morphogenesis protein [Halomonas sp.]|uniref:phage virion morphogenesis protein n=1 Tax=Halomonas sp. TaxID=1486246 RepID=UPI00298D908A|nr:phage virion morphogenesis protein [Halomonas sp.]MDW7748168.1 phage virion morphogenesis protein [Halomonas sp.]